MSHKKPHNRPIDAAQDAHTLLTGLLPIDPQACCDVEASINTRLRRLRREQGLSIRTLAARCDLSPNTLSLIENGHTSPSVHTLQLLARGLGVALVTFFEEEKPEYALVYQRAGQRPLLRFANGTLEKLGAGLPPLGAEPILVTLDPGQADVQDIRHLGREFIYCLTGKVICIVAGQEYPLLPGDSLLFDASAPHRWSNADSNSSRLLVLFCPIEGRDQPAERHLEC